jgi:TRAP-type C4-dicarboxylate transport system permease small subunit
LLYPIMSQRSRVFNQLLMNVIVIIFVLFLYLAILKWTQISWSHCSDIG